jgi:hypothetical protein
MQQFQYLQKININELAGDFTFPPPNLSSSPYLVQSLSTSITRALSPR